MTNEEAIQILDDVVNNITMNRASWIKIEEALKTMRNLVQSYGVAKQAEVKK